MIRRSQTAALLAAALAAAAMGCGKDDNTKQQTRAAPTPPPNPNKGKPPNLAKVRVGAINSTLSGTYAGVVEQTNAYLAIVVRNGRAMAYMNDGSKFGQHWTGDVRKNGDLQAQSENQVKLDLRVGAKRAAGAVRLAAGSGDQLRITAPPVGKSAGYFRGSRTYRGKPLTAEWVVLNSKAQHGIVIVGGKARAAPPLKPGAKVVVLPGIGRIQVHRVVSPAAERT